MCVAPSIHCICGCLLSISPHPRKHLGRELGVGGGQGGADRTVTAAAVEKRTRPGSALRGHKRDEVDD